MNAWIKRLLALVALVGAAAVSAQGYPNKTIRLVVPYPAGGTLDALTRTLAPELSKELGQQVIVDNRAGASDDYSSEALLDRFLAGQRVDVAALKDFVPSAAHEEIELPLQSASAL